MLQAVDFMRCHFCFQLVYTDETKQLVNCHDDRRYVVPLPPTRMTKQLPRPALCSTAAAYADDKATTGAM